MRTLLFVLILIALFSGAALWYQANPGFVEIIWLGYQIEMNIAVFIGLAFLSTSALYVIIRFVLGILNIPYIFRRTLSNYHVRQGLEDIEDGLTALYIENPSSLKRIGHKLKSRIQWSRISDLFIGHGALLAKDYGTARDHFHILTKHEATAYLGFYGLARVAVDEKNNSVAIAYLDKALSYQPQSLPALYMRLNLLIMEEEVEKSLKQIENLLKQDPDNKYLMIQRVDALMKLADQTYQTGPISKCLTYLKQAYKYNPQDLDIQIRLIEVLQESGKDREAEKLMYHIWETAPHDAVASLYLANKPTQTPIEIYKALQDLLKHNPDHVVSLKLKAKHAANARLWGPAHEAINQLHTNGLPASEVAPLIQHLQEKENQR